MDMKKLYRRWIPSLIVLGVILYLLPYLYCRTVLNTSEEYPEDVFLTSEKNKKALILVAHDDDWYGCAGTIGQLCEQGWEVSACCFYGDTPSQEDSIRTARRKEGILRCAEITGLKEFRGIEMNLRYRESEAAYRSIPYSEFGQTYRMDSLESYLATIIEQLGPSVIFTLDDSIGLYGHPEHVLISRTITRTCENHGSRDDFPVRRIYQSVLPPDMAEGIMVKYSKIHPYLNCKRLYWHWTHKNQSTVNIYSEAKITYRCNGMPLPDVEVPVRHYSALRKDFISCFPTERKNFKRFVPFFNWYPGLIYYGVFDKEYYRIIEI